MNRNEVTTINRLIVGDIFYKHGDAKKAKLQLHQHDELNKRWICVDPELQGPARDKEFLQKWLKPDTRVVFLRRTQHTDIGDPSVLLPTEAPDPSLQAPLGATKEAREEMWLKGLLENAEV